jgi:hypothetical protein
MAAACRAFLFSHCNPVQVSRIVPSPRSSKQPDVIGAIVVVVVTVGAVVLVVVEYASIVEVVVCGGMVDPGIMVAPCTAVTVTFRRRSGRRTNRTFRTTSGLTLSDDRPVEKREAGRR